jgi:hypothetical protein
MKRKTKECGPRYLGSILCLLAICFLWPPLPLAEGAPERRFQGIDLSTLREVKNSRYRSMPEIYELDLDTRRFRLVDTTIHLQIDGTWITYNPTLKRSYLNKVPGENEGSYFGPIDGDPFDLFKLEERYIEKFRDNYAPDEMYRIRLMLRSGNPKLRERALRIIMAALAPEVKYSARAAHVAEFRKALEEHKGADLEPVFAAIQATEKAIDDATPTYPDEAYAPGNETLEKLGKLKDWMKLPGPVPDSTWGEPLNGMRAAAVFSPVIAEVGAKISVWLVVENVSDHQIKFALHDVIQMAHAKVKAQDGTDVKVTFGWATGLSPIYRHRLQPKERLTVVQKTLFFDKDGEGVGFGQDRVVAGVGEYQVKYREVLGNGTAKGEWGGRLTTGETKIMVAPKAAAAASPTKQ